MDADLLFLVITVFVLAIFVGVEIINKVPPTLHTPLMSGTNAISGIMILGDLVILSMTDSKIIASIIFFSLIMDTVNIVGGFVTTNRMLKMFKKK